MAKHDLAAARRALSGSAHKKTYTLGEGIDITIPRLSLGRQGEFELLVRKRQREEDLKPTFSLSGLRNKSNIALAACLERAAVELRSPRCERCGWTSPEKEPPEGQKCPNCGGRVIAGMPEEFENDVEEKLWETKLKVRAAKEMGPYFDELFSSVTQFEMAEAVAWAMQQEYGEEDADGVPIDAAYAHGRFDEARDNTFENAFLIAVGLSNEFDSNVKPETPKTADQLFDQAGGDPKASSSPQEPNSTTPSASPSSEPSTDAE